jgi:hypothetical protein
MILFPGLNKLNVLGPRDWLSTSRDHRHFFFGIVEDYLFQRSTIRILVPQLLRRLLLLPQPLLLKRIAARGIAKSAGKRSI